MRGPSAGQNADQMRLNQFLAAFIRVRDSGLEDIMREHRVISLATWEKHSDGQEPAVKRSAFNGPGNLVLRKMKYTALGPGQRVHNERHRRFLAKILHLPRQSPLTRLRRQVELTKQRSPQWKPQTVLPVRMEDLTPLLHP
ncbi:uncharacterized protein LOC144144882 [Haemaphysalis longicornis]